MTLFDFEFPKDVL